MKNLAEEVSSFVDKMNQFGVDQSAVSMDDLSFAPTASGASFSPSTSISLPSSASSLPSFPQIQQQHHQQQQQTEPSRVFMDLAVGIINKEHLGEMFVAQRQMMTRFEKTNEMLQTFNELATQRYGALQEEYTRHSQALLSMKRDLDNIFKRIRIVKATVTRRFPVQMEAAIVKVRRLQMLKNDAKETSLKDSSTTSGVVATSCSTQSMTDDVTHQTPSPDIATDIVAVRDRSKSQS